MRLLDCVFTFWDVAHGEEADPRVAVHRPLLRLAVGLTAVVHEAGVVPLGPGVNDARRLVKSWLQQRSPLGHTCGWHSYCSMRFRHSDSKPHGRSSAGLQLHLGISETSAV
ncbi:hypothetical protein EYF80_050679 [Liparis tanakae]|uniref:Uncharacterized protein n=1 Tax=Liparis tanakae TaxID=230148 RepID=A0A4Z2FE26_9TELE|nr:hypothetical protein EYF80_050679 [Liparis tanakae]